MRSQPEREISGNGYRSTKNAQGKQKEISTSSGRLRIRGLIGDKLWQWDAQYPIGECSFYLIGINLNRQVEQVESVPGQDLSRKSILLLFDINAGMCDLVQYWTEMHPYGAYYEVALLSGGLPAIGISQPGGSMQAVSSSDQINVKLQPWFGFDTHQASERSRVIYPSQRPCHICCVVRRVFKGTPMEFYHLAILADSGGELYIPVDKTQAVGIRPLLEKYEVALLLDRALFMSGRHACRSTITAIRYWDEL